MKNFLRIFIFSLSLSLAGISASASAAPMSDSARDAGVAAQMMLRLNEIQAMDKTSLSPSKKKELRKELMQMKKKADGLDRKVYLSVGAIIIIILLLILILR